MTRTKGKIETASLQDLYSAAAEESEEMGLQVVDINIDDLYRYSCFCTRVNKMRSDGI